MWKLCGFLLFLSSATDGVTTELALTRPGIVESNPWMQDIRIRVPAKIAGTAFIWWATERLYAHNRIVAWVVRIVAIVAFSYVSVGNIQHWRGPP